MSDEAPPVELPTVCPKCGSQTIFGFGLAGGGMGPYVMCEGDCDFFQKRDTSEDSSP